MTDKRKVKVMIPDGSIIERVPKVEQFGNFAQMTVRYNNDRYLIGDGTEYLRGVPDVFLLGRKISGDKSE
jgi:hypothetical protein